MPIWLRKFTFLKLKEHYENLNTKQTEQLTPKKSISRPDIRPNYSTKASK